MMPVDALKHQRNVKLRTTSFCLLLLFIFVTPLFSVENHHAQKMLTDRATELIKDMTAGLEGLPEITLGGESIYAFKMLERFYSRRSYQPAWSGSDGFFPHAEIMADTIEEAGVEGLVPDNYHLDSIRALTEQLRTASLSKPEVVAELDILLTDAFLMLGCHFSAGCVDPVTLEAEWFVNRDDLPVDVILDDALRENKIRETLRELLPQQTGYTKLRERLIQYEEIVADGAWPVIAGETLIKKGHEGQLAAELRDRLVSSGDMDPADHKENTVFDDELEKALMRFQKRHGLNPDGIVGPETREVMNVSAEKRLRQIEVNLERMRWASRNLGHRYILVNIADYKLDLVEHNETVMTMEVVVGKPYWHTPVFSRKMRYLILNPWWNIPDSIAKEEILPRIKKNPEYLEKQNIGIYRSWTNRLEEVDPNTIDWHTMKIDNFPHILRQEPGPLNPLGHFKFMLPNEFNIYLHDTPAKEIFSRNSRAFSHGCIRVKRPTDLAEYLLKNDPAWTRKKILSVIDEGKETRIDLENPISVHLVYLTAWVDKNNVLHFRNDIYGRDARLDKAMKKTPGTQSITMHD